jgi:drug/metabolite transporter (DMT)-like permease
MFFVLLLYALFASVFVVAKYGLEYTQPIFLVGARMFLAGGLLVVYQYFKHGDTFQFKLKGWTRILLLAACNIYLTNVFELWGLQFLSSSKTCLIYGLSPFLSALFAYLIFSERLSWKKWTGLIIGFLGLLPTLLHDSGQEGLTGTLMGFSFAEIAVLLATIFSVYGWILLQQLVRDEGCSPLTANGLSMLIGGAVALLHSGLVETWNPFPFTEFLPFIEATILLLIISNLVCYNLYGFLLKRYSATFMSFAGGTTPYFTALFGWIILGESVGWPFFISTFLVFAGLLIFYQEELRIKPLVKAVN